MTETIRENFFDRNSLTIIKVNIYQNIFNKIKLKLQKLFAKLLKQFKRKSAWNCRLGKTTSVRSMQGAVVTN